uniref:13.3 kDa salivary protein n=1 Tax=Anopheles culicifacies TaxID=139723 RepID=A0A182MDX6_9DIPT
MKFLVLSVVLCTLVVASTAQTTKSPAVVRMQSALGSMLAVVREMSMANKALVANTDDQEAVNNAFTALENLYNLFPIFGSTNSSALPLATRTKLNSVFSSLQNAVAGWETALDQRTADNLVNTFRAVEDAFLTFAGVVFAL